MTKIKRDYVHFTELTDGWDYCPSASPYIWSDDAIEGTRAIIKTRCGQWTCPYCAQVNRIHHYYTIKDGCDGLQNRGYNFSFVTLTSHQSLKTMEQTYKVWQKAWRKLSTRYRRAVAKTGDLPPCFVYISEAHADGRLHWHGIFSGDIPQRWWKDNCAECGLGYMAESEQLQTALQAANYCLKYIVKNIGQDIDIARFRRINYSRNFPRVDYDKTSASWHILEKTSTVQTLITDGWLHDKDVTLNKKLIEEIIYE